MYEPGQYEPEAVPQGIYADEPQRPVYSQHPSGGNLFGGGTLTYVILGALVLSLLLSIVAIVVLGTTKGSLQKALESQNATISSLESEVSSLQQANSALQGRVATLETAAVTSQAPAAATTTPGSAIEIAWAPSDTSTTLGRTEALMLCVAVKAEVNSYSCFTWQKLDTSNNWKDITFADGSNNTELGIRLYTDIYGGYTSGDVTYGTSYSQLWCAGLTESAFGTYRCMIKDANGTVSYTEPALISQKPAEAAEA